MLVKGVFTLIILVSIVSSNNVYGSTSLPYSNYGSGFSYSAPSNGLQYGNLPTSYTPNLPLSYIPNTGVSSASGQYANYGVSTNTLSSAPVYVPAPLSGATASSSSQSTYSSSSSSSSSAASSSNQFVQNFASVPANYAVVTQSQDSNNALSGSYNIPASTSNTFSTSGSISGGFVSAPTYSPSTTLGQISNVQYGAQVVTSSTASQVANSQNTLIQGVPSSPNPIKYEVTTVAK